MKYMFIHNLDKCNIMFINNNYIIYPEFIKRLTLNQSNLLEVDNIIFGMLPKHDVYYQIYTL